jgi:DNA polymerase-3 subunit gamma/tau
VSEQLEPLALKYRPARFSDVMGQQATAASLYYMARRRRVRPGMLFHGEHGCGKTSTARIFSASLNCAEPPGPATAWPCGACPSCKAVADCSSLDVTEIDAASNGSVERVRELREQALYGTAGEWHGYVLDEAHRLSDAGFDALLKILEEPPPQTFFLLLTTEPGKVRATVRSRCLSFLFRAIPEAVIRDRLAYICRVEGIPAAPELLAAIAEAAEGAMRDAIMQLDLVTSIGITTLDDWRELTGEFDFATAIIGAAAGADYAGMYAALDQAVSTTGDYTWVTRKLVRCLRDMLVLTTGAPVSAEGDALARRRDIAASAGPERLRTAMKVLWDLQTRVAAESRRDGLTLAVTMLCEALCPPASISPAPVANGHSPIGEAELRSMLA